MKESREMADYDGPTGPTSEQVEGVRRRTLFAEWRALLERDGLPAAELALLRQRLAGAEFLPGADLELLKLDVIAAIRRCHGVTEVPWPFPADGVDAPDDPSELGDV
jgi:hypothetical protein